MSIYVSVVGILENVGERVETGYEWREARCIPQIRYTRASNLTQTALISPLIEQNLAAVSLRNSLKSDFQRRSYFSVPQNSTVDDSFVEISS